MSFFETDRGEGCEYSEGLRLTRMLWIRGDDESFWENSVKRDLYEIMRS